MKYLAGCLFASLLGSALTFWLMEGRSMQSAAAQQQNTPPGPTFPNQPKAPQPPIQQPPLKADGMTGEEQVNVSVYQKVNRSVVNITTRSSESFFLMEAVSQGTGSGCILDKAGHVLTNFHVIEDARTASVTLFDGKSYEATLVGADPINDLVVLKIDAPKESLFPVTLADSRRLQVGMRVFAIGNPFGLERTMTTGIISSLNRSLKIRSGRTIRSIIQIDAAVNPGNSGGPLLDTQGRLIGVNMAIATRTGQSAGVGFAIPSSLIARVVPQLIKHGHVIRPEIGILRVYETGEGLLIAAMKDGGPAEKAGLRGPQLTRTRRGLFIIERLDRSAADLIVEVDGKDVKTADDFLSHIERKRPGDRVTLTIIRKGRRQKVAVTLGGQRR